MIYSSSKVGSNKHLEFFIGTSHQKVDSSSLVEVKSSFESKRGFEKVVKVGEVSSHSGTSNSLSLSEKSSDSLGIGTRDPDLKGRLCFLFEVVTRIRISLHNIQTETKLISGSFTATARFSIPPLNGPPHHEHQNGYTKHVEELNGIEDKEDKN
ncbi:hypothetical protein Tco_0828056 [Tanacetum coccineum]